MSKIIVFQTQNFDLVCECLRDGYEGGYYDNYVFCPEHGQWWTRQTGTYHWQREHESDVPRVLRYSLEKGREADTKDEDEY